MYYIKILHYRKFFISLERLYIIEKALSHRNALHHKNALHYSLWKKSISPQAERLKSLKGPIHTRLNINPYLNYDIWEESYNWFQVHQALEKQCSQRPLQIKWLKRFSLIYIQAGMQSILLNYLISY